LESPYCLGVIKVELVSYHVAGDPIKLITARSLEG
jgi:hypothetical protein